MIHKAKIKKIMASRILVELDDKTGAWLLGQELSSEYDPTIELTKQNLCKVDQEIDVIVYGREVGGKQKLVSAIRVKNDPWDKVRTWQDHELKEMEVHSVTPRRAFGKIEPGIEGYVDLKELYEQINFPPSWDNFKIVFPRDCVAGYVKASQIDHENRLIKLDVISYIKSLAGVSEFLKTTDSHKIVAVESHEQREESKQLKWDFSGIHRIVLVDDDEAFADDLGNFLKELGVNVDAFHSEEEFNEALRSQRLDPPEFAFVDLHLRRTDAGLYVAKSLEEWYPDCRILLATADQEAFFRPESLKRILEIAGETRFAGIIYKPLSQQELRNAISYAISNETTPLREQLDGVERGRASKNLQVEYFDKYSLDGILNELRKEIRASAVVLFSIHPVSNEVEVVNKTADHPAYLSELNGNLRRMLCYSPVKDVAIKREHILERKISGTPKQAKHRYLHRAVRYESCIAYPVKVPSELAYCLFAFHKKPNQFNYNSQYKAKAVAGEIGRILEIRRFVEIRREDERYLITGKSYGKLAHDLRTKLPDEFKIERLTHLIDDFSPTNAEALHTLKKELKATLSEWRRVLEVVNTFHRMFMHKRKSDFDEVDDEIDAVKAINEVTVYLQDRMKYSFQTKVEVLPGDPKLLIRIREAALEQVLVNLLMNAAQQINRFFFARKEGLAQIEARQVRRDGRLWGGISVYDSGPGIHWRDFDRVFDIGFTTTENGLGMGLDICRDIVLQANGKIRVKKSILFVGTTFEILLPLSGPHSHPHS